MIETQTNHLRCTECRHLFTAEFPIHSTVEVWAAVVQTTRCPSCGIGPKGITFGQGRSLSEDRAYPRGTRYEDRISAWIANGECSPSSEAIFYRMSGRKKASTAHPDGIGGLHLCFILLDRFPEWKNRMHEMAKVSAEWADIAKIWPRLTECYFNECGPDLDGRSAVETYALLKAAIDGGEEPKSESTTNQIKEITE